MLDEKRKPEFVALFKQIGNVYEKEASMGLIGLYWQVLEDYDFSAIKLAVKKHLSSPDQGRYFPKPADLILIMDGGSNDQALIAWSKVDRAVHEIGGYSSVVFDDHFIHLAIEDIGGWPSLGLCSERDWQFVRNRFIDTYRMYLRKGEQNRYPHVLLGRHDLSNLFHGYQKQVPIFIGDPILASKIYQTGATGYTQITTSTVPKIMGNIKPIAMDVEGEKDEIDCNRT